MKTRITAFHRLMMRHSPYAVAYYSARKVSGSLRLYFGIGSSAKRLGLQLLNMNRDEVLSWVANVSDPEVRLQVGKHFFDLGWLGSAQTVLHGIRLSSYPLSKWPEVGVIISAYRPDEQADELLDLFIKKLDENPLPESRVPKLIEWLTGSGFDLSYKLDQLAKLKAHVTRSAHLPLKLEVAFNWAEYNLRKDANEEVDVREFVPDQPLSGSDARHLRPFLAQLRLEGYPERAFEIAEALHDPNDPEDFERILVFIRYFPYKLDFSKVPLPSGIYRQLRLMAALNPIQGLSEGHARLFDKIVKHVSTIYRFMNLVERDEILRALMAVSLHESAQQMVMRAPPTTDFLLPVAVLRGWEYFEKQDFESARVIFEAAFVENPYWEEVSLGFRYSAARSSGSLREAIDVRKSLGIPLPIKELRGQELRWSFWVEGKYVDACQLEWYQANWSVLDAHYGDRFLRYKLPDQCKGSTLFFIAELGVGDEIRSFKYYRWLAENFASVTATCDPRLESILKFNFPEITFLPVWRYRIGLMDRLDKLERRIKGFSGHLFNTLTEDIRPIMDSSDFIMCDVFPAFVEFQGLIPPLQTGVIINPVAPETHSLARKKLRVGLLWRSHLVTNSRRLMYFPYEHLTVLLSVSDIEFHSIQYGMSSEEKKFCATHGVICREDIDMYNDFDAMANYLSTFYLVIGISTVPAELAAALGVPVWYLGFSPENYFLRTAGGTTEIDQLTANAQVITAPDINFEEPVEICIDKVLAEVRRRLDMAVARQQE